MKQYRTELEYFLKKTYFIAFLMILALVGYGFSMTHPTINIDTLPSDIYIGDGQNMLQSGRFGNTFWSILFGFRGKYLENHFVIGLLAVLMLIWAAINFCILFRRASQDRISSPAYLVFCGFLISHPIMTEIWEYQGANLYVCGDYLLVSFSLLSLYTQLTEKRFCFFRSLFALSCMTIVCSSYESLVVVYIFCVLGVLYLQEQLPPPDWKNHFFQGIFYCLLLIAALICRVIIQNVILSVFNLTAQQNGATEILWFSGLPVREVFTKLMRNILYYHITYGILYYPLAVTFVSSGILLILSLTSFFKKKPFSGFLLLGMVISLELLSLITGVDAPYRTCQVFSILSAYTAMLVANRLRWKQAVSIFLCYICLQQAIYLSQLSSLNYIRYEEEIAAVDSIGTTLSLEHDLEKEVIFVGDYDLSSYVTSQLLFPFDTTRWKVYSFTCNAISHWIPNFSYLDYQREFPDTNVNSVLGWSTFAFGSQEQMQKLFCLRGYDIKTTKNYGEDKASAEAYAVENNMPAYPNAGYIVELPDYIIVRLGTIY